MNFTASLIAPYLWLTAIAPAPADSDSPVESPAQPDAGTLFRQGRYPEAAAAFEREYADNPDPALLFGRAVALQRSGDCFAAIEAFETFIAAGPPAADIAEGERQIEQCRAIIEANAGQPAPADETNGAPTLVDAKEPGDAPVWYRDRLGGALVGVGGALVVTGAALYGASFAVAGRDQPAQQTSHEARRSSTESMAAAGLSVLAVGGVLAVAGAIRWGLVARRSSRQPAVEAIWRDAATIRF